MKSNVTVQMVGRTVLLASRATCMFPTRMCAIRDVRPSWIRTTYTRERGIHGEEE